MDKNLDIQNLIRMKKGMEVEAKERYKQNSKERLGKIGSTKIKTTMIGALETVEKYFGFLWTDESKEGRLMKETYEKVRSEILDKGNTQIRNLLVELDQYDVEWKRYTMQLPVRPMGGNVNE